MATKGLLNWSTTAATNATADSQAQFAEGQAPSSLNDGIRGLMSSMALYRNDISGSLTTGGTSTAYTVTTNQDATTLAQLNAQVITIVPHATNGDNPTLSVNTLTAKQIRTATGVNVASGTMVAGTPYQLVYFSSAGEFILMNFASNPYNVPLGSGMDFWGTTAPNSNFAFPYGQAISRTTYSALFALFSTTYGTGDGSTTFNIPDKRGRVTAGKDDMGGSSADRLTNQTGGLNGDTLGATGGNEVNSTILAHTHGPGTLTGTTNDPGDHTHSLPGNASGGVATGAGINFNSSTTGGGTSQPAGAHTHTVSLNAGATASQGSGTAHNIVQPTIAANYIIRII